MQNKEFLKNHVDTLAIIGVNIAIAAIMLSMILSHSSEICAVNSRMDTIHVMFYDLLKEKR